MEWLWAVDDHDEPVGRIERTEAHARAVRHRAGVVLLCDAYDRIYLTRRSTSKAIFPGTYDTSASFHVSYGETYDAAARRESLEELGLDKAISVIGKFRHDDPPEHQFVAVFVMEYAGEQIALDSAEAHCGEFYSRAEALRIIREERCTPWLCDALKLVMSSGPR
jgi:isopentenyldiphosphate isomerase